MTTRDPLWNSALDPTWYFDQDVAIRREISDAAKVGDFDRVLARLKEDRQSATDWRLEGTSWFTPLHQAAWHGVPLEVADELLWLGAFRGQPDAKGRIPADIAHARGHRALTTFLRPRPQWYNEHELAVMSGHLHEVMRGRARQIEGLRLRAVPVTVLIELRPAERL